MLQRRRVWRMIAAMLTLFSRHKLQGLPFFIGQDNTS